MTTSAFLSSRRPSTWDSRCPRGMWIASGSAPWSYSSGSRTSRTIAPAAMRLAASAVSTSVISFLVALSRSRNVAMIESLPNWSGIGYRDQGRQQVTDLTQQHRVREAIHGGRLTVHDHDPGSSRLRPRHDIRGREHGQRGTDRQQQVAFVGCPHRLVDHLRDERLPERDRVALQDSDATV